MHWQLPHRPRRRTGTRFRRFGTRCCGRVRFRVSSRALPTHRPSPPKGSIHLRLFERVAASTRVPPLALSRAVVALLRTDTSMLTCTESFVATIDGQRQTFTKGVSGVAPDWDGLAQYGDKFGLRPVRKTR